MAVAAARGASQHALRQAVARRTAAGGAGGWAVCCSRGLPSAQQAPPCAADANECAHAAPSPSYSPPPAGPLRHASLLRSPAPPRCCWRPPASREPCSRLQQHLGPCSTATRQRSTAYVPGHLSSSSKSAHCKSATARPPKRQRWCGTSIFTRCHSITAIGTCTPRVSTLQAARSPPGAQRRRRSGPQAAAST